MKAFWTLAILLALCLLTVVPLSMTDGTGQLEASSLSKTLETSYHHIPDISGAKNPGVLPKASCLL